jgi:hypothetical protein
VKVTLTGRKSRRPRRKAAVDVSRVKRGPGYSFEPALARQRQKILIRTRLAAPRTGDPATVVAYKVHTYRGLAAQAHLEVEWAKDGLRMTDDLETHAQAAEKKGP